MRVLKLILLSLVIIGVPMLITYQGKQNAAVQNNLNTTSLKFDSLNLELKNKDSLLGMKYTILAQNEEIQEVKTIKSKLEQDNQLLNDKIDRLLKKTTKKPTTPQTERGDLKSKCLALFSIRLRAQIKKIELCEYKDEINELEYKERAIRNDICIRSKGPQYKSDSTKFKINKQKNRRVIKNNVSRFLNELNAIKSELIDEKKDLQQDSVFLSNVYEHLNNPLECIYQLDLSGKDSTQKKLIDRQVTIYRIISKKSLTNGATYLKKINNHFMDYTEVLSVINAIENTAPLKSKTPLGNVLEKFCRN